MGCALTQEQEEKLNKSNQKQQRNSLVNNDP